MIDLSAYKDMKYARPYLFEFKIDGLEGGEYKAYKVNLQPDWLVVSYYLEENFAIYDFFKENFRKPLKAQLIFYKSDEELRESNSVNRVIPLNIEVEHYVMETDWNATDKILTLEVQCVIRRI